MAGIEDFAEGFVKHQVSPQGYLGGSSKDFDLKRQHALELKMLSKQIEMQLEAKKALFDYEKLNETDSKFFAEGAGHKPLAGTTYSVPQASLFQELTKSKESQGSGLDANLSPTMARLVSEAYGIPYEQALQLKVREGFGVHRLAQADETVVEKMSEGITTLRRLPEFYGKLKKLSSSSVGRSKLMIAQIDSPVAQALFPDVKLAESGFISLFQFSRGGKNVTLGEREMARRMATAWQYGPDEVRKAEKDFSDMVQQNLSNLAGTGKMGLQRTSLIGQINEEFAKVGIPMIPLDYRQKRSKKSDSLDLDSLLDEANKVKK